MARAMMYSSQCRFVMAFDRWWVHSMSRARMQSSQYGCVMAFEGWWVHSMARARMHSSQCWCVMAFERRWVHSMTRARMHSSQCGCVMAFEKAVGFSIARCVGLHLREVQSALVSRLAVLPCSPLEFKALQYFAPLVPCVSGIFHLGEVE